LVRPGAHGLRWRAAQSTQVPTCACSLISLAICPRTPAQIPLLPAGYSNRMGDRTLNFIKSDAIGTYANENRTSASLRRPGRAMTQGWTGSGNPGGRPRGSRNRAILSEEFIAALLRHFRRDGERAIARMARTQPAAYCKLLGLPFRRSIKSSIPARSPSCRTSSSMR
jgi:hypothetical protein